MVTLMIIKKLLRKWIKIRSIKYDQVNMRNCCTTFSKMLILLFLCSVFKQNASRNQVPVTEL